MVRDARRCRAPHHEGLSDLILRRRHRVRAKRGPMINSAPSRRMTPTLDLLNTRVRIPAARCARVVRVSFAQKQRAQGNAGCPLHPQPRAQSVESTRVSHHRFTGTPGLPCAMVLTAYFVLSPVTGLSCHRRCAENSRELDASVGAPGPHVYILVFGETRRN